MCRRMGCCVEGLILRKSLRIAGVVALRGCLSGRGRLTKGVPHGLECYP